MKKAGMAMARWRSVLAAPSRAQRFLHIPSSRPSLCLLPCLPPPPPPSFSIRPFSSDPGLGKSSSVIPVKTDTEYLSALNLAQENGALAVVYFTAKWCAPCKMISPVVDELSMKYDKATFLKVDIDQDELQGITSDANITSVPTFKFYRGGKSIAEVVGANATELKNKIGALCK